MPEKCPHCGFIFDPDYEEKTYVEKLTKIFEGYQCLKN